MKNIYAILIALMPVFSFAQNVADSVPVVSTDTLPPFNQKIYYERNGDAYSYNKPKTFGFITNIPGDGYGYLKQSFQKENLYKIGVVAASTAALLIFDQQITDGLQSLFKRNNISAREDFNPIVRVKLFGKNTNLGKWPRNANTAIYNIGQGSSVILIAAGLFISGKINNDNRALQTASQLGESFLALGFGTQVLKYATGRENPSDATVAGGRWRPFPSFSNFQNNKPKYDAFPSGHLATFVSAVTILSENYPSKKWIKPIGYILSGLLSLTMVNNGVHWVSDYPLGFALGYGYGKYISKRNKIPVVRKAW